MLTGKPVRHSVRPSSLAEVVCGGLAALVAAAAVVYLLQDFGDESRDGLARIVVVVALVAVVLMILAVRQRKWLERLKTELTRDLYWQVYSDVLSDLGGLDGETSTDSGRLPRRP